MKSRLRVAKKLDGIFYRAEIHSYIFEKVSIGFSWNRCDSVGEDSENRSILFDSSMESFIIFDLRTNVAQKLNLYLK